ncbi:MAG: tetratricopeptide repeat protein [Blastocatellia bacterium]|nr:tetratricopeptide repeat protein [Blastocatellia bacterium]
MKNNTRHILSALFFGLIVLIFPVAFAQTPTKPKAEKFDYESERTKALELTEENKYSDALPILEKLAAARPDDAVVLERLALSVLVNVTVTKKPAEALKKDLLRVRSLALKSKDLGNNSRLVQLILEKVPADGNPEGFIDNRERTPAEEAIYDGEGAFAKGDMKMAIEHYQKAAQLDPKLYEAPLFIGDVYYKLKDVDKAGEFYARAIAIDPDRETAYRYWGNALMSAGRMDESREKFIDAIISAPYNQVTWQFLAAWARRNQKQLVHPRIDIPTSSANHKDDKNSDVLSDTLEKKDGSESWTIYSVTRAAWMTEKQFAQAFPAEKEYRHSLREEAEALRLTAEKVATLLQEGKLKESALDVSIANLLKLHRAGLIEPYVLLAIPDAGIAHDYAEYRKTNQDKLRKYLNEYVIASN